MSGLNRELIAKVLIVGEAKVGKTSILSRYTEGVFQENIMPTLGIDYRLKLLEINKLELKLQIWDTAGQERFRSITQNFYKGAHGIILVFDLSDVSTFNLVENWLDSIRQLSGKGVCLIILGNKSDLESQVAKEDIDKLCQDRGVTYYPTSAKQDTGIKEAFQDLAQQIVAAHFTVETVQPEQGAQLDISEKQKKKKKGWC